MRLLILSVLLLVATLSTKAQTGFGPEIGVGMSTMRFAPALGFTSATTRIIFSGKVGGLVDASISKHFYGQAGIFFSRRGQERTFSFHVSDSVNASVEQTLTIHYIDIPLSMVYKTGTQGQGRFTIGIGATPGYIIGGNNKLHQSGTDSGVAFSNNFNKPILATDPTPVARFDLGVNLSAGYELPTGLFFRAYYTSGVQDIGRGTEINKNRMWGISVGYLFGKGRNINKETEDLIDKSTDQ
jgi:hypothetical protein